MKSLLKICAITFIFMSIGWNGAAQTSEEVFHQGMVKEEGEGNLEEAINIYSGLVNNENVERSIRAKALFQMGVCYEKLGRKKAASTYQKLISEYGDQKDLILAAKQKLKALHPVADTADNGMVSQRLQKGIMGGIFLQNVSPDGKYYTFLDTRPISENAEEIVRYEFGTGKTIPITVGHEEVFGEKNSFPWGCVWSTDGKKIAYSYVNYENQDLPKNEVYLANIDGSERKVVFSEDRLGVIGIYDFSPDGSKILVSTTTYDNENVYLTLKEITIDSKDEKTIMEFNSKVNSKAEKFRYAPKGPYVAFNEGSNIRILNTQTSQIANVTSFDGMDWSATWNWKGDKLLFISDRQGSNDLFAINIVNGKPTGTPTSLKRYLGEGAEIMGIDRNGAVYISAHTSRNDVYTIEFTEEMDIKQGSAKQITIPSSPNSNGLARFSKDGKYISYQSALTTLTDAMRRDINSKYSNYDKELGWKYHINIYNTETGTTKLLDLPIYINHYPRSQRWQVPNWSYHGNQLLVHGRIPKDFTGGFFIIDVEKETITPTLTKPNCKVNMKWNEVEMGNSMFFSRKKDLFYYSANGWKEAMQYNIKTGEVKTIATIEDGFWFEGFLDKEETKLNAANRYGYFEYDINTHEKKKYAESGSENPNPLFLDKTKGFSFYDLEGFIVFPDVLKYDFNKELKIVFDSGVSKNINLTEIFPESLIRVQDYSPEKNQMLLTVEKNPGTEIYKLSNVFE